MPCWDYKGVDGAYGTGSHRTGFPGIIDATGITLRAKGPTKSPEEIFTLIRDDLGYGSVLSDIFIEDLTEFVVNGQLDTDDIIDGSGAFTGDAVVGEALFGNCTACHGEDGLAPPFGNQSFDNFPGFVADDNPWEFQHKVSCGQPGTAMPAQVVAGLTVARLADLGAYAQTLPQGP